MASAKLLEKIPDTLRLVYEGQKRILLEEKPQKRLYAFGNENFYIALPWMYYSVTAGFNPAHGYRSSTITKLYCSPRQIGSVDQPFSSVPLPNLYSARPCYSGSDQLDYMVCISNWWNQVGNTDAFPWRHPFIQELAVRGKFSHGLLGPGTNWNTRTKMCYKVFETWEELSERTVRDMDFGVVQATMASLLRPRNLERINLKGTS